MGILFSTYSYPKSGFNKSGKESTIVIEHWLKNLSFIERLLELGPLQ